MQVRASISRRRMLYCQAMQNNNHHRQSTIQRSHASRTFNSIIFLISFNPDGCAKLDLPHLSTSMLIIVAVAPTSGLR